MSNPFGEDMDDVYKQEEAASMPSGRIPPGTYKAVCTQDPGSDVSRDHEIFEAGTGTKGLKIFLELLEPEEVNGKAIKGEILEHVFWVTKKNIPYVKRDVATILGKAPESLAELAGASWAGNTCEVVVKDEERDGYVNSRVKFINPWKPKTGEPGNAESKEQKQGSGVNF